MPRSFGTTNAAPYAVAPPVGAEGDMYFNTTSDTLWLSDGTQWIQIQSGGFPEYGARARRNVDQAIGSATSTVVMTTIMTEVTPGATWYDGASGGLKVPAGAGGRYLLAAHCRWEAGLVTNSALIIFVNGIPVVRDAPNQTSKQYFEQHCACAWTLNAGDVVTLGANHQTGGNKNISTIYPGGGTDPAGPILEVWKIDSKGDKGDKGDTGQHGGPVPIGGKPFQVLTKNSTTDGDTQWRTPPAAIGNPTWVTRTLMNGWSNYGGQFQPFGMTRRNGVVYLRGLITRASNCPSANYAFSSFKNGYGPFINGNPANSGQHSLWWVPAANGGQLARLDINLYSYRGGGTLITSDQLGSGVTNAGWMTLGNVSWALDELNGIESGFESVLNPDQSITIQPGVVWMKGKRYEFDGGIAPASYSGSGSAVRVVWVASDYTEGPVKYQQWSGTDEQMAEANCRGNGNMYDSSGNGMPCPMVCNVTSGVWADRREWI